MVSVSGPLSSLAWWVESPLSRNFHQPILLFYFFFTFIFFFWCLALINHTVGEQSLTLTNKQKRPPFFLVRVSAGKNPRSTCKQNADDDLAPGYMGDPPLPLTLGKHFSAKAAESSISENVIRAIICATLAAQKSALSTIQKQKKCIVSSSSGVYTNTTKQA